MHRQLLPWPASETTTMARGGLHTAHVMQHAICSAFLACDAPTACGHLKRHLALVMALLDGLGVRVENLRDAHVDARPLHGPDGVGVAPASKASDSRGSDRGTRRWARAHVPRPHPRRVPRAWDSGGCPARAAAAAARASRVCASRRAPDSPPCGPCGRVHSARIRAPSPWRCSLAASASAPFSPAVRCGSSPHVHVSRHAEFNEPAQHTR